MSKIKNRDRIEEMKNRKKRKKEENLVAATSPTA